MRYNLYIRTTIQTFNLFGISEDQVQKIVQSYLKGEPSITLTGKKHILSGMQELKIFEFGLNKPVEEAATYYLNNIHFRKRRKGQNGYFLPSTTLAKMGKNVTASFLGDAEYGQNGKSLTVSPLDKAWFVSESRLKELRRVNQANFDLARLIQLCDEINSNYSNGNYLSVGMIARTIINHIPPIFDHKTFDQFAANYGGPDEHRSFKKSMKHLNESLRNIADSFLHQTIRNKEILPNENTIDFKQDLDVLLGEIVRKLG